MLLNISFTVSEFLSVFKLLIDSIIVINYTAMLKN